MFRASVLTSVVSGNRLYIVTLRPGSADNDSAQNGSSGKPLPRRWDVAGHDIGAGALAGNPSLAVSISGGNDCLTPVADIVNTQ